VGINQLFKKCKRADPRNVNKYKQGSSAGRHAGKKHYIWKLVALFANPHIPCHAFQSFGTTAIITFLPPHFLSSTPLPFKAPCPQPFNPSANSSILLSNVNTPFFGFGLGDSSSDASPSGREKTRIESFHFGGVHTLPPSFQPFFVPSLFPSVFLSFFSFHDDANNWLLQSKTSGPWQLPTAVSDAW
jgi:hypothetical protein